MAEGGKTRKLRGALFYIALVIAVGLSLFQLYTAGIGALTAMFQRGIHIMLILAMVFLYYPLSKKASRDSWDLYLVLDLLLAALSFVVILYIMLFFDEIIDRQGDWTTADIVLGIATIFLVIEAARRVIGGFMATICVVFVLYAFAGPYLPGLLGHKGYNLYRVVGQLYLTTEGIFGLPLGVAATFVFVFVLFGSLLEGTGGGNFFTRLAYACTGRMVGGPAKTAVIASGFMGSISGSAIANVVTTGSFTIPMMKKTGYRPHEAGGIEAAASTGGQLMPPIMGAGAFLMAEFTNTPYLEIIKMAAIPAIMYYFAAYCYVHFTAKKAGMLPLEISKIPRFFAVIKEGYQFLFPIAVLVYFLLNYYSPMMVGFAGVVSVVAISYVRKATRIGLKQMIKLLEKGAENAVMVSTACAAAGIIVGMVTLTGLGLKFSSMVVAVAGGVKLIAILMVGIASLFLGMGLPVTASYIVLVILAGPALMELGVALITAHMIVFWYSQTSNVTPPVALAGFAGAAVAGAPPMKTSFSSCKAALGIYVIPIVMAYRPLLLDGQTMDVIIAMVSTTIGLLALSAVMVGFLVQRNRFLEEIVLVLASLGFFLPYVTANAIALVLLVAMFYVQYRRKAALRPAERAPA